MTIIKWSIMLSSCIFLSAQHIVAQESWMEIKSVKDLCANYPNEMNTMFDLFDLDYKGLERVKSAKNKNNISDACKHLLEYYKNGNTGQHFRKRRPAKTNNTVAFADTILKNVFVIQNVRGQVPFGDDGHRSWYYKGPNNDKEWAWLSNRHSQINKVLNAYFKTGNPKYANYIDLFLRDFIIKSLPYPAVKSNTSVWRGLEVSFRSKTWSRIFYGLINSQYFSPSTQLLLLSSLPNHAHYNRNFHGSNNWLTMEISALATIATNFPEYKNSREWLEYSIDTMVESMKNQVYPDGVQTELTSHYHNVSLSNFELFKNICKKANKKLPDFFNETIENMYSYLAHVMRPDGNRILNNDGDRGSDRNRILRAAKKFHKKEWEYIATNGESGTKPLKCPSYFYPWAGQLISRSGYATNAHWSFFDVGPWGSGHQHNDKLHISISAYGRDLLVDAGRFAYTGEVARKFRSYARSSAAHNVILIENKGQEAGPKLTKEPLDSSHFKITDDYDYATNSMNLFSGVDGKIKHVRSIFYLRGELWVVVDRIITDRPRKIDVLWHWHPDCAVEKENAVVRTKNATGNLAIFPVSQQKFEIEFIQGQETPEIQGWYSPEYNLYEPNITSCYTAYLNKSSTLVWLLLPSEKKTPNIKTEILNENDMEVKIEVKSNQKSWQLNIAYNNSKRVFLTQK